jgi:hypothetical protein
MLKGVTKGFPLKINAIKVKNVAVDYNKDFIMRTLQRIEYDALRGAVNDVSLDIEENLLNLFILAWFEYTITGDNAAK